MKKPILLFVGAGLIVAAGLAAWTLSPTPNSFGQDLPPVLQETVDRAEAGERAALRQVGLWLSDGTIQIGTFDEQQAEARLWLKRAVDLGDADAALKLAYLTHTADPNEADRYFTLAAEGGNLEAQLLLADEAKLDSLGPNPDAETLTEAAKWYLAAAEQGDAFAQFVTGTNFRNGTGVEADPTLAAEWFGRSARQGEPAAQLWLAESLAEGLGVPQDFKLAHVWANIAAGQGDVRALELRLDLENRMTAEQVAEAQTIASLCLASGFAECR